MKLLLDPHGDDGALFASFVIQREQPDIIVVFDSYIQVRRGHKACNWKTRRNETGAALGTLGIEQKKIYFLGWSDDFTDTSNISVDSIIKSIKAEIDIGSVTDVWIPLYQTLGHKQHNLVSLAGSELFRNTSANINFYATYTTEGKTTSGEVVPPTGIEIRKKLQALIAFRTQIEIDALGCWPHFIRDQNEYITKFVRVDNKAKIIAEPEHAGR